MIKFTLSTWHFEDQIVAEEEQIEEILEEANAYNLRQEVKDTAEKIFKENNMFSKIDAYVRAYYEIIEKHE